MLILNRRPGSKGGGGGGVHVGREKKWKKKRVSFCIMLWFVLTIDCAGPWSPCAPLLMYGGVRLMACVSLPPVGPEAPPDLIFKDPSLGRFVMC